MMKDSNKLVDGTMEKYTYFGFIKDLIGYIRPYKWKFLIGTFSRFTSDLSKLYPAWALSRLVIILPAMTIHNVSTELILLIVGWVIINQYEGISHSFAKFLGYQVAENASLDAKLKALKHIFDLDLQWQEKENTGSKIKRINNGRDGINRVIRIYFNVVIEAAVNIIGITLVFLSISPRLSLFFILFIITFYVIGVFLSNKAADQEHIVRKKEEYLSGISFEALNNIGTVKSLGIYHAVLSPLKKSIDILKLQIKKRIFLFRFRSAALTAYFLLFESIYLIYLVYEILQGNYQVSILVLFVSYFDKVGEAVWELSEVTHEIVISKISIRRMMAILNTKPTILDKPGQRDYELDWKKIILKDVSFAYEGQEALKKVSFDIVRGEKIGLVGRSGAGKSTLFKLLMDLYENYQGDISLDKIALKDIKRSSYINNISVVLQETELFNTSLKENILVAASSNSKIDSESLQQAIVISNLDEVVARLPRGVDTIIGEKGVKLSGGEKQRLGIARAVFRKPDLLLLDEATSHLDIDSEKKIQEALHKVFETVTAVVIAHRLSTIKEMDRILLLDHGKILEQGSFNELLKKKGEFYRMWQKQSQI